MIPSRGKVIIAFEITLDNDLLRISSLTTIIWKSTFSLNEVDFFVCIVKYIAEFGFKDTGVLT